MHKRISGFFVILLFLIGAPYGYAAPGQIFEIQVGAYSDSENAEMMRKNIEQQGYTVFTREIHDQNGKKLIQVLIGPFSKGQQADSALNRLKTDGIDSFIRTVEHPVPDVPDKSTVTPSVPLPKTNSQEKIIGLSCDSLCLCGK